MASNNEPRAVLITGASGSLGTEMSLALARAGYRVWAGVRALDRGEELQRTAQARGTPVDLIELDVRDDASIDRALSKIEAETGPLYGLINNAAVTLRGYLEDLTDDEIVPVIDTNLLGPMRVVRRALPAMRSARRGRILHMSSIGGRIGTMGLSAYIATKFGLEGFGESLYLELAPFGIAVILIEPGIVRSRIWEDNRRIAARALSDQSPYLSWFKRAELAADELVRTSKLTPNAVAETVLIALEARRPRLRYVVGRRAGLVLALRRYLPGELFERLYFREVLRRVTGGGNRR